MTRAQVLFERSLLLKPNVHSARNLAVFARDSDVAWAYYEQVRATPLVRVLIKVTVKNVVCESLRRQHTAILTVNLV